MTTALPPSHLPSPSLGWIHHLSCKTPLLQTIQWQYDLFIIPNPGALTRRGFWGSATWTMKMYQKQDRGRAAEKRAMLSFLYAIPLPFPQLNILILKKTLNPQESWKDSKVNPSNNFTELQQLLATWCIRSYLSVCLYNYLIHVFMYLYVCLSIYLSIILGFPDDAVVKNLLANPGDAKNINSTPGFGNGSPLQYFYLKKSMKHRYIIMMILSHLRKLTHIQ